MATRRLRNRADDEGEAEIEGNLRGEDAPGEEQAVQDREDPRYEAGQLFMDRVAQELRARNAQQAYRIANAAVTAGLLVPREVRDLVLALSAALLQEGLDDHAVEVAESVTLLREPREADAREPAERRVENAANEAGEPADGDLRPRRGRDQTKERLALEKRLSTELGNFKYGRPVGYALQAIRRETHRLGLEVDHVRRVIYSLLDETLKVDQDLGDRVYELTLTEEGWIGLEQSLLAAVGGTRIINEADAILNTIRQGSSRLDEYEARYRRACADADRRVDDPDALRRFVQGLRSNIVRAELESYRDDPERRAQFTFAALIAHARPREAVWGAREANLRRATDHDGGPSNRRASPAHNPGPRDRLPPAPAPRPAMGTTHGADRFVVGHGPNEGCRLHPTRTNPRLSSHRNRECRSASHGASSSARPVPPESLPQNGSARAATSRPGGTFASNNSNAPSFNCYKCGAQGHMARQCPTGGSRHVRFVSAQGEVRKIHRDTRNHVTGVTQWIDGRPFVTVEVARPDGLVEWVSLLLDSGAEVSCFDPETVERVGAASYVLTDPVKIQAASGSSLVDKGVNLLVSTSKNKSKISGYVLPLGGLDGLLCLADAALLGVGDLRATLGERATIAVRRSSPEPDSENPLDPEGREPGALTQDDRTTTIHVDKAGLRQLPCGVWISTRFTTENTVGLEELEELLEEQVGRINQSLPEINRNQPPVVIEAVDPEDLHSVWSQGYPPTDKDKGAIRRHVDKLVPPGVLIPMGDPRDPRSADLASHASVRPPLSVRQPGFVVYQRKPDGSIGERVVYNMKEFNPKVDRSKLHVDLEDLRQFVKRSAQHEYHIVLDLAQAYNQVPLDLEKGVAIYVELGGNTYRLATLPMGLATSPAILNAALRKTFAGDDDVSYYFDDVHAPGEVGVLPDGRYDVRPHTKRVARLMHRLNSAGWRVKPSKMVALADKVDIGGWEVHDGKIGKTQAKTLEIRGMTPPTTCAEARSFLGFVTYFHRTVPGLAHIVGPLHAVANKRGKLSTHGLDPATVEDITRRARDLLLAGAPLHTRKPGWRLELATDASRDGFGAVLFQVNPKNENEREIIAYNSRPTAPREKHLSPSDLETTGAIFGVRSFEFFLRGEQPFVLLTDHRALVAAFNKTDPSALVRRYWDYLSSFSFTTAHIAGTLNVLPDALSRMYRDTDAAYETELQATTAYWDAPGCLVARGVKTTPPMPAPFRMDVRPLTARDIFAKDDEDEPHNSAGTTPQGTEFRVDAIGTKKTSARVIDSEEDDETNDKDPTTVPAENEDNSAEPTPRAVSQKGGRNTGKQPVLPVPKPNNVMWDPEYTSSGEPIPPICSVTARWHDGDPLREPPSKDDRQGIVHGQHLDGHGDFDSTANKIRALGWDWYGLTTDTRAAVATCIPCQRTNVARKGYNPPAMGTNDAIVPNEHLMVDCATYPANEDGVSTLLVIVCAGSRFIRAVAVPNKSGETIAAALRDLFYRDGPCRVLSSDNGGEFVNGWVSALLEEHGIEFRTSTPYNPVGNGVAEAAVKRLTNPLLKQLEAGETDWVRAIGPAVYAANTARSNHTGSTPFALWFARTPLPALDYSYTKGSLPVDTPSGTVHAREEQIMFINDVVRPGLALRTEERARAKRDDPPKRIAVYHPGDAVMVANSTRSGKTESRYFGPYIVHRRTKGGSYVLHDGKRLLARDYSPSQLKFSSAPLDYGSDESDSY